MAKKVAEITLRVYVDDKEDGKHLCTAVEVKGTNNEVMNIAELAQNIGVFGEAGVEQVLLNILNEEKPITIDIDGPLH